MSTTQLRFQKALDRILATALAGLIVGTTLAFGGAVWWAPAAVAVLTAVLASAWLVRAGTTGGWRVLKSPLTGLGVLAIGLAIFQSAPLPSRIAAIVSPNARAVHSFGLLPDLARADDPDVAFPEATSGRSPLTLDRSATLRWLAGAAACLAVFWVVSHHADRLGRLYLVWGSVVAGFLINTAIVLIGLVGQADGLYGFIEPGKGPKWAPTVADALAAPGETTLRPVGGARPTGHAWALALPDRRPLLGTLPGGPDAYLALAALGLPLALAITLQLMAPRGSREGLWTRLGDSGQGSLLVLLYIATVASALLVGLFAGPRLAVPYAGTAALVGVIGLIGSGLRWKGGVLTTLVLAAIGCGVALGPATDAILPTAARLPRVDFDASPRVWADALDIVRDFPLVGVGLGGFATVGPYYKSVDSSSTTARSSLIQWVAESGAIGVVLLAVAALWGLIRLPSAIRRVGSADRALAAGMIGAVACFAAVSTIHWTVELPAVALAAAAVAGTIDRWLAGGTDLFVERD